MLDDFAGGRVIVGVTSTPFKCPPAPSETALLLHDFLTERGPARPLRDLARHAAAGADPAVARRIGRRCWRRSPSAASAGTRAGSSASSTPSARSACSATASEMPYDLFLGVPVHRAPAVVAESGLTVDGWIPVDPLTLETAFPGVYAVGDVTSVGTPKAGVFAEGQAAVVADRSIAGHRARPARREYDGRASATSSSATTRSPGSTSPSAAESADGTSRGRPSCAADKAEFGSSRIQRWFGRDWTQPLTLAHVPEC